MDNVYDDSLFHDSVEFKPSSLNGVSHGDLSQDVGEHVDEPFHESLSHKGGTHVHSHVGVGVRAEEGGQLREPTSVLGVVTLDGGIQRFHGVKSELLERWVVGVELKGAGLVEF